MSPPRAATDRVRATGLNVAADGNVLGQIEYLGGVALDDRGRAVRAGERFRLGHARRNKRAAGGRIRAGARQTAPAT